MPAVTVQLNQPCAVPVSQGLRGPFSLTSQLVCTGEQRRGKLLKPDTVYQVPIHSYFLSFMGPGKPVETES